LPPSVSVRPSRFAFFSCMACRHVRRRPPLFRALFYLMWVVYKTFALPFFFLLPSVRHCTREGARTQSRPSAEAGSEVSCPQPTVLDTPVCKVHNNPARRIQQRVSGAGDNARARLLGDGRQAIVDGLGLGLLGRQEGIVPDLVSVQHRKNKHGSSEPNRTRTRNTNQ